MTFLQVVMHYPNLVLEYGHWGCSYFIVHVYWHYDFHAGLCMAVCCYIGTAI
jgi:uncharacterized protein YutD